MNCLKSTCNNRHVILRREHHALAASVRAQRPCYRRRLLCCVASNEEDYLNYADEISKKYSGAGSSGGAAVSSSSNRTSKAPKATSISSTVSKPAGNGVFTLILINVVVFVLHNVLHLPFCQQLLLNHRFPQWYQFITSAFCHGGWDHLSGNMFELLIFGKLIEESEGAFGVWFTYIITALGGSVAGFLTSSVNTVSMGASGAVFGMFAVAVLLRLKWNLRSLLEAGILGQFVIKQVWREVCAQTSGGLMSGGAQVGHMAHLGGAMVGVLLVLLLTKLPDPGASATA